MSRQHVEEFIRLEKHAADSRLPTRGLDLNILTKGYGIEDRGVVLSYQAQAAVLGAVLPSNSPGVHTLWLPVIPLQMGLVLKPGPQEPWTPYRMTAAFVEAWVGHSSGCDFVVSGRPGSGSGGIVVASEP